MEVVHAEVIILQTFRSPSSVGEFHSTHNDVLYIILFLIVDGWYCWFR
jgi:hypothetical protein